MHYSEPMPDSRPARRGLSLFLRVLISLGLLGVVAFIFFNSSQSGLLSSAYSKKVMVFLNDLLSSTSLAFRFTHYQVRKLAHFLEYTLLGFWLVLTLRIYTRRLVRYLSWPLLFGLLIPMLDETYQLTIPGRSGQLADVWIDFGGIALGVLAGLIIVTLITKIFGELGVSREAQQRRRER